MSDETAEPNDADDVLEAREPDDDTLPDDVEAIRGLVEQNTALYQAAERLTPAVARFAETLRRNNAMFQSVAHLNENVAARNAAFMSLQLTPAVARFAETLRRNNAMFQSVARLNMEVSNAWLEQSRKLAETISRDFSLTIGNIAPLVEAWQEQLRAPNWDEMPPLGAIQPIVLDEGIPLVWIPRSEIVMELAHAGDSATRDQILLTRSAEIAEDCAAALKDVAEPRLGDLTDLANVAVRALVDGHHESAQALAGNVYDSFLHDACRRGVMLAMAPKDRFPYRAGRKVMEVLGPSVTAADFLSRCVMSPMRAALEEFFPGQPPLAQYSRHASAHAVSRVQYTPRNAVVAVMVMASMLRQAQESG